MTCRGFAWTIFLSWYSRLYLIGRSYPYLFDMSPLCWYPYLGSWFLWDFHLTCNILLDPWINSQTHIHRLLQFLRNYVLNWHVGVDFFYPACHKLDLLLLVWTLRWYLFEISSALASISSQISSLAYEPSRFTFSAHSSLPSTYYKIMLIIVIFQCMFTLIKGQ